MATLEKLEEWKKKNPDEARKIQEIVKLTEKYISEYQFRPITSLKVETKTISSLTAETTL